MNESGERHPGPEKHTGEDLCAAALIRLAADDELTPAQQARLEAHLAKHPEDAARIEFERGLRSACARACCPGECAPAALRERVRARCCEPAGAAPHQRMPRRSADAWNLVTRFGALAALVALVALVGYISSRPKPLATPVSGQTLAASLAGFVRAEHDRCAEGGPTVAGKFYIHEPGSVPEEFSAIVGRPVSLVSLEAAERAGLRFVDAGLCHPPGGDAMHIRFRASELPEGPLISLWVQLDDGRLPLQDGVTYTLGDSDDGVWLWRAEGLRYVLVCPDQGSAAVARSALESPGPTAPL